MFLRLVKSLLFLSLFGFPLVKSKETQKPNFLLMLADDLGIGDLGCYGNDTIRTPNIDSLAEDGVKLTHLLAAASVCTPSRASFLTGRYPQRYGLGGSMFPVIPHIACRAGLDQSEVTFAEVVKKIGYKSAVIGKWHQGVNKNQGDNYYSPLKQGFDHYYGNPVGLTRDLKPGETPIVYSVFPALKIITYSILTASLLLPVTLYFIGVSTKCMIVGVLFMAIGVTFSSYIIISVENLTFTNGILLRNDIVVEQPIRFENSLTKRLVKEATYFIEERHNDQQPFLLFMSWHQVRTCLHAHAPFVGRSKHGRYGDEVEEMDWSVGEMLKLLDRLGFRNNTFVMFGSDHGGHVEDIGLDGQREGGWNGQFRGGKFQGGMEGGIRVPGLIRWPAQLPKGLVINHVTSLMDFFPTLSDIINQPLPVDKVIDGKSLLPLLKGQTKNSSHEFLFHFCEAYLHAVRWNAPDGNVWKVRYATPKWQQGTEGCAFKCSCSSASDVEWHKEQPRIYAINDDPGEYNPMDSKDPKYQGIVDIAKTAAENHVNDLGNVKDQLQGLTAAWLPQLQPCCNFPFCSCHE